MHGHLFCVLVNVQYIYFCFSTHSVQIGTFSPQNYTVREGDVEELTIKLDRPSVQDTIFNVATMNLTATSE